MNGKIRQVQELPITEQKLGKTIKKRKKLVSSGNNEDIKFLVENTEIKITKTNNSNAGMDRLWLTLGRTVICQVKRITDLLRASTLRTRFSLEY